MASAGDDRAGPPPGGAQTVWVPPALTATFFLVIGLGLLLGLRPAPALPSPLLGAHLLRTSPENLRRVHDLGFEAFLQLINWEVVEPDPGRFDWEYPDQVVAWAEGQGLRPVLRLDHPPRWATGREGNAPPRDAADYERFVEAVARRYQGRVAAYILWNEPNLTIEWGGLPPNPAAYLDLLRAGYTGAKRGDPAAVTVAAGLSSTNGDGERAIDDRVYLRELYRLGAAPYFDVLAAHPYGFGRPASDPALPGDRLSFLRVRDLRAIMEEHGDAAKPVWATEYGYTTRSGEAERRWQVVAEEQQARYLADTLDVARRELPWLTALFLWNVSADLPEFHEMQGYSVIRSDGRPKPAYLALRQLTRRPAPLFGWGPDGDQPVQVWPWRTLTDRGSPRG
ncbi:MAG TPA: hypothetical protein VHL09_17225 [Dehalococcoidia bacterium]|nr:hypothetical protein [Dehalococcoidia bacterium]